MAKDRIWNNFVKRVFDFQVASLAIIAFSPILLVLYCLIRLKLGKPVFFAQKRAGFKGKHFKLCKFRSMTDARDADGNLLPDDERMTKFGTIIRNASLDELPTLFNVIKGDLSFVGPRPLHIRYVARYSTEQLRRLDAVQGITGWAQLKGRNALSWSEKFGYDISYVENSSFLQDIFILVATLGKVFMRSEVSHEGHSTMPEFMGNEE